MRSGQTVSKHFNNVLKAMLRLYGLLLKKPAPITANCTNDRWSCFQNCFGALDGTYVKVLAPAIDKPRYRTRNGEIATNVLGLMDVSGSVLFMYVVFIPLLNLINCVRLFPLGCWLTLYGNTIFSVCSQDMQFIYVLPGWEGSASDSWVLRDAVSRPNGLKVPTGMNMGDMDYSMSTSGNISNRADFTKTRKKRARPAEGIPTELSEMAKNLGSFIENTNTTMMEIAHRIGYSHNLSQQRRLVNEELLKLPMSTTQRLMAASIIVKDENKVDLFFSLDENDKMEWVSLLLEGHI
ncbi:hypothetical protein ACSBR2_023657 [Camellia fascicularis]